MRNETFKLEEAIAILQRTPATLNGLLSGLSESWTNAKEGEDKWSAFDVVGHLVSGDRTDWIPRARHILTGAKGAFNPFDRNAQFIESQGKSLNELLTTFTALRHSNVTTLLDMHLTNDDLARKGLHPSLGEVTMEQLISTWVVHDLDHIAQIVRTMAKAYTGTTGPWSEYLSILRDRQA
jgi:DinB superfamily